MFPACLVLELPAAVVLKREVQFRTAYSLQHAVQAQLKQ